MQGAQTRKIGLVAALIEDLKHQAFLLWRSFGPDEEWRPDCPAHRVTLITGETSKDEWVMVRRAPTGEIEYRAMTDDEDADMTGYRSW